MGRIVAELVHNAGIPAIAVNETYRLAPWADMLYGCDAVWWNFNAKDCLKFAGLKVTKSECVPFRAVNLVRTSGRDGYDAETGAIRTGLDSSYQATHIVATGGAKRILLCGVDLGGINWHGRHKNPLRTSDEKAFAAMRSYWPSLATGLAEHGIEVINCSTQSSLNCFPCMRIEEALEYDKHHPLD